VLTQKEEKTSDLEIEVFRTWVECWKEDRSCVQVKFENVSLGDV
jgi:hypothetical protein